MMTFILHKRYSHTNLNNKCGKEQGDHQRRITVLTV